jgi:hypothetical protein
MNILRFYLNDTFEIVNKAIREQPIVNNSYIYKTPLTYEQIQIIRKVYTLLWESVKLLEENFHNTLFIEFASIIFTSIYIGYFILEGVQTGTIYPFIYFEIAIFVLRIILIVPNCQNCINVVKKINLKFHR